MQLHTNQDGIERAAPINAPIGGKGGAAPATSSSVLPSRHRGRPERILEPHSKLVAPGCKRGTVSCSQACETEQVGAGVGQKGAMGEQKARTPQEFNSTHGASFTPLATRDSWRAGRPRGRRLPNILVGAFVAFAILLFADRIIAGLVAAHMGAL